MQTYLYPKLPYGFIYRRAYNTIFSLNEHQQYTFEECNSFWTRMYLLCWFNKPKHNYVHIWYKTIKEHKYLKFCMWQVYTDSASYITPVANDHPQIINLYEQISSFCTTDFLYRLFWVVFGQYSSLKLLIDNYRRFQYAKRLFTRIQPISFQDVTSKRRQRQRQRRPHTIRQPGTTQIVPFYSRWGVLSRRRRDSTRRERIRRALRPSCNYIRQIYKK